MPEELIEYSPPKKRSSMCVGCGGQIHDQYILRVAPDLEWHATCLKCAECGRYLDESCTCFVREGKTYCKKDYLRLFGARCAKCKEGFSKNDFVMRARSKIYHIECFRCVACSRQLIPGDEYALRDDGLLCKADNDILGKPNNGTKGDGSPNGGSTDYNGNRTHQANGYNDSSSNEEQPTNNKGSHGGSSGKNGTRKDKTTRCVEGIAFPNRLWCHYEDGR